MSTARDTHHLLATGVDGEEMLAAVRAVERLRGGIVVIERGAVVAQIELPIAGLMSTSSVDEAALQFRAVTAALVERGCRIEHPTTMLALLAVSAIPELRIGNRGLIDSRAHRLVPVAVGSDDAAPVQVPVPVVGGD